MTMSRSQRDTLPMSRLRVFREADFADDEAPTEPGGFALALGTGTIGVRRDLRSLDAAEVGEAALDAAEPDPDDARAHR
jgi:hypothetical protein